VSRAALDWSDTTEVSIWLAGLRSAFDDADAVTSDMLRQPRARQLGPALHEKNYTEAREQILHALAYATPEPDEGEPSDPAGSGSGGAGAVH
jgi:hypothetical protein